MRKICKICGKELNKNDDHKLQICNPCSCGTCGQVFGVHKAAKRHCDACKQKSLSVQ